MQLSLTAFAILLSPALALLAMTFVLPGRAMPAALRAHLFPFTSLAMFSSLLCYSIWNLNDVSWGTKGLTGSSQNPESRRQSMMLRNAVFGTLLLANGALVWCAAVLPGFASASLNAVTEASCMLETALVLVALLFMAGGSAKRLAARSRASNGADSDRAAGVESAPDQLTDGVMQPWQADSLDPKEPLFVETRLVRGNHELRRVKDHTLS